MNKTTPEQRAEIVELALAGHSPARIAERFGISDCRVGQIMHAAGYRKAWRWEKADA